MPGAFPPAPSPPLTRRPPPSWPPRRAPHSRPSRRRLRRWRRRRPLVRDRPTPAVGRPAAPRPPGRVGTGTLPRRTRGPLRGDAPVSAAVAPARRRRSPTRPAACGAGVAAVPAAAGAVLREQLLGVASPGAAAPGAVSRARPRPVLPCRRRRSRSGVCTRHVRTRSRLTRGGRPARGVLEVRGATCGSRAPPAATPATSLPVGALCASEWPRGMRCVGIGPQAFGGRAGRGRRDNRRVVLTRHVQDVGMAGRVRRTGIGHRLAAARCGRRPREHGRRGAMRRPDIRAIASSSACVDCSSDRPSLRPSAVAPYGAVPPRAPDRRVPARRLRPPHAPVPRPCR